MSENRCLYPEPTHSAEGPQCGLSGVMGHLCSALVDTDFREN